jgi:hypothetical protein
MTLSSNQCGGTILSCFLKSLCYSAAAGGRLNKVRGRIKESKSPRGRSYHVQPRLDEKSLLSRFLSHPVSFILQILLCPSFRKRVGSSQLRSETIVHYTVFRDMKQGNRLDHLTSMNLFCLFNLQRYVIC